MAESVCPDDLLARTLARPTPEIVSFALQHAVVVTTRDAAQGKSAPSQVEGRMAKRSGGDTLGPATDCGTAATQSTTTTTFADSGSAQAHIFSIQYSHTIAPLSQRLCYSDDAKSPFFTAIV
jgi:hypothetical protein